LVTGAPPLPACRCPAAHPLLMVRSVAHSNPLIGPMHPSAARPSSYCNGDW